MTGGLTATEEQTLLELLGKVTQPYSRPFNESLCRLVPPTVVELVLLRGFADRREVLLTQRPDEPGDPWPGAWHCPGTIMRVTDHDTMSALVRLAETEIGSPLAWHNFVYNDVMHNFGGRPLLLRKIYRGAVLPDATVQGAWHNLNALPKDIIPEHIPMIQRVAHPS